MSRYDRQIHLNAFRAFMKKWNIERHYDRCCICQWMESIIDLCHIIPDSKGGDYSIHNIVPLCPNHHRLLDKNILKTYEIEIVTRFIYSIYSELEFQNV